MTGGVILYAHRFSGEDIVEYPTYNMYLTSRDTSTLFDRMLEFYSKAEWHEVILSRRGIPREKMNGETEKQLGELLEKMNNGGEVDPHLHIDTIFGPQ